MERAVAPLAVAEPFISCQAASQAYEAGHGDSNVRGSFATMDGASTVDMDVVANIEVLASQAQGGACGKLLDTAAAAAQVGACGHVLDTVPPNNCV